ncbi:MAG TPA: SDR family NAD(P)-dependent oxidoreductase [Gaiellaceae bacterium]|jgi:meso-butanediol dehydrogenase/(S,S)-butanediol dehydrogenase/diacetyl reductase|nr:SDR family NAD(P)-dependent oxidoreductase [Gaiellaceae bacterium]
MSGRVAGRVVIVTGGAGGIGAAACRALAREGGKVVVGDLDADRAQAVADAVISDGGEATSVGVDVTDRASVRRMIETAVDLFGELNVIFNNAGMNRPRGFMEVDEDNFEQILRVNTWGVIVCTQEAAKQMIAQGSGGKIINTGSIASRQGFWDFVPYCVAKFGVLAVTQATARGLVEHGITVNAFAPGVVDTPMWVGLNEDIRAIHDQPDDADPMREFATGTLVGRPAAPEELAPFLVYLASPESDYMTGQMYMVDGGQVLV